MIDSKITYYKNSRDFAEFSHNLFILFIFQVFPKAKEVALTNCIACELHVTLTQQPTNITYMRQHIHTLELISADYFIFPRLVYPCPNLETLHIEKPTNDVFNIDAQNVPFLYGNTVPFENLKHLKLSRISLTNLSHFLSKSSNLKRFKVNIWCIFLKEKCILTEKIANTILKKCLKICIYILLFMFL